MKTVTLIGGPMDGHRTNIPDELDRVRTQGMGMEPGFYSGRAFSCDGEIVVLFVEERLSAADAIKALLKHYRPHY